MPAMLHAVSEPAVQNAKRAAMDALAALSPFEPVARVEYSSQGRLLVVADRVPPEDALQRLAAQLTVSLLWTGSASSAPKTTVEQRVGELSNLTGYLGAFELTFQSESGAPLMAPFDLVLDLQDVPAMRAEQPPQGYFHAPHAASLEAALAELPEMTGEFEKPKFFAYKESLCVHSRSKKTGCNQCIDVCSTNAIRSAGDTVEVDPHLCMGCGACATVCPSGAMSYQFPRVADRGAQLKAMLGAWRREGKGQAGAPVVLFHNGNDGRAALDAMPAGIPVHVLPLEAWHVASIGIDVLLAAVTHGAGHVAVLAAGSETPAYRAALQREIELAQVILHALGYSGKHFSLLDGVDGLTNLSTGETPAVPAGFNGSNDKRTTIEFAVEHLLAQGKNRPEAINLKKGSPFGAIAVDTKKCTLCLACAGACPSSALMDGGEGAEKPVLKFLERNCVQCGLCETTCPEQAIALEPRLLLTPARKQTRTLNEAEPFNCISCGKVLGTRQIVDAMLGRLAGHSMFQAEGALKRLQMCADCRVVDMMSNKNEVSILTGKPMA
ncbi:MAG: 4Fe-4S binding protein [Betaproteobacteria bacterium]|nr:4Fe-4S binding protein [Betaproteobacteria bacterium]